MWGLIQSRCSPKELNQRGKGNKKYTKISFITLSSSKHLQWDEQPRWRQQLAISLTKLLLGCQHRYNPKLSTFPPKTESQQIIVAGKENAQGHKLSAYISAPKGVTLSVCLSLLCLHIYTPLYSETQVCLHCHSAFWRVGPLSCLLSSNETKATGTFKQNRKLRFQLVLLQKFCIATAI